MIDLLLEMMELVYLQYLASPSLTPSWLSKRKSYSLAIYAFFPLVLIRHVTETDNLHTQLTQVTQGTNSRNRQKTIKIVRIIYLSDC